MAAGKPRFVVADPSLYDEQGHHLYLARQITHAARLLGLDVVWLTHRHFVPEPADEVKARAVFSVTMYDRFHPVRKHELPEHPDRTLLNELVTAIADLDVDDHVFFPTVFGDLFDALALYTSDADWQRGPCIHACTPFGPDVMPGKQPGTFFSENLKRFRTASAIDRKLFFWAEIPQLAEHYTLRYGFNVRPLLLPPPRQFSADLHADDSDVLTATYLGAAREEKGFLLLPELVRHAEGLGLPGKLRFVIHCKPKLVGSNQSIEDAIRTLASYPDDYVQLVDMHLEEESYLDLLLACDVAIQLYDKKVYRLKGSMVSVEAICADKCLLTHKETFCASLITQGGGAAVDTVEEAAAALAHMAENKSDYRRRAQLQGRAYRSENSLEKYVARIIGQTDESCAIPFFPSSMIGHVSPTLLRCY
jgi:hypothetical protein